MQTHQTTKSAKLNIEGKTLIGVGENNLLVHSVVVPQGVETIGRKAFRSYKFLASVTLPSGLRRIGTKSFSGCTTVLRAPIAVKLQLDNTDEIQRRALSIT